MRESRRDPRGLLRDIGQHDWLETCNNCARMVGVTPDHLLMPPKFCPNLELLMPPLERSRRDG